MFSIFRKKKETTEIKDIEMKAYISGKVIPIEEVGDEVFASGALGGGIAIEPVEGNVTAPCEGVISLVMEETKHAVGMTLDNGAEILLHEGIDTVDMKGDGFNLLVSKGQRVKTGDPLFSFDLEKIRSNGFATACICVLTNEKQFPNIQYITGVEAKQGETIVAKFN